MTPRTSSSKIATSTRFLQFPEIPLSCPLKRICAKVIDLYVYYVVSRISVSCYTEYNM